ncbi:AsmA family protein [Stenotrophobium rhamnosiphilum]|uniref:AsmA domain-containing protein n=1 Tax=Stenotrophobium rhamnosiphilum TaxID=2029166 RepID=A0A2T5MB10_9GAMM|nr:AsmA family protein [Stenotrophobium rhamnosiphilum]PTU27709.1 hypothetical protein CJD38_18185 [Stenotrophobium rhamnosiphilum]
MNKPLKIILGIVGGVIALTIVALVAAVMMFDPNSFRGKLSAEIKDRYHRDLLVGDIKLSVFPWLSVKISDVSISNAEGFGKDPFAQVGMLDLGVRLLPLLKSRKIEASGIALSDLTLNLEKNAKGESNWADFTKDDKKDEDKEENKNDIIKLKDIDISGIELKNATVHFNDAQGGKRYAADKLNLSTGGLTSTKVDGVKLDGANISYSDSVGGKSYVVENLNLKTGELSTSQIGGVEMKDVTLRYNDSKANKSYAVEHLNVKTGTLKMGSPADVEIGLSVASKSPEALVDLKLLGTVLANFDAKTYTVNKLKLTADLSGAGVPGGKQTVQLTGNTFFDQGKGVLLLSKTELQAAGITINTDITGTGLSGDTPRLSGPIKIQPFKPREVMSKIGMKPMVTADKDALSSASLNAQYMGTFKSATLSGVALNLDQTAITGNINISDFATKALSFALKVNKLDADRYLAPKAEKTSAKADSSGDAAKKAALNATKIPSDALNALNVNGTLDIGSLKISGVNMSNVQLKLSGEKDKPKQQEISANLYGGQIKATSRVDGTSYAVNTHLQGLNAAPFLKDLVGKDPVSGTGNLNLDIIANGATVGDVRRSLNGSVNFALQNGAVKGFNLGQIIRKAQALATAQAPTAQAAAEQQTDFATFSASGKFVNGILKTDTLDAKSPLLRLTGAGEIDLVNEIINYVAKPTIVETSQGQGGKELDALRGVTIPIQLSGSMYAPKYNVMFGDIAKQQAVKQLTKQFDSHQEEIQKKLNEKLGDKLGGELGGALGKLFGSKKPAPAAPAAAPTEGKPATPAPAAPAPAVETKPGT